MSANPIFGLDPDRVTQGVRAEGLLEKSDLELLRLASEVVAVPRREVTSFVMHAPLELMARYRLLSCVHPESRELARLQLLRFAALYAQTGEAQPTVRLGEGLGPDALAKRLLEALEQGSADDAQGLAAILGTCADAPFLARALGQAMLQRLGAAAHGPIFLYLLLKLEPPAAAVAAPMLAPLARLLATQCDQRLTWTSPNSGESGTFDPMALERALLAAPRRPFAGGIAPIMRSAEDHRIPQRVIGPRVPGVIASDAAIEQGFAAVCRVAALTMIEEGPREAKYGWSHCLTLPHAVWEISHLVPDRAFALRVAATYVAGMRAAIGRKGRLKAAPKLSRTPPPLAQALLRSPQVAAAAGWSARDTDGASPFRDLVSQAAIRPDAHLVKYSLAAWDASQRDPGAAPIYQAGAAFLAALWMGEQPGEAVERMLGLGAPEA